jgi:hypothetical protein
VHAGVLMSRTDRRSRTHPKTRNFPDERTLVPGDGATLFDIRFEDWILEAAAEA